MLTQFIWGVSGGKTLLDVSGFDISQVTNQDAELNQKLLNKSQQAIYISSNICVWYYPRKTWDSLCLQYFKYGRGRYLTSVKYTDKFQLRGKLPFIVISATGLMLLIDLSFSQLDLHMGIVILFGLLFPFLESLRIILKFGKNLKSEMWRGIENEYPCNLNLWFFLWSQFTNYAARSLLWLCLSAPPTQSFKNK